MNPQPIAPTPDFPVAWEEPGDERLHWTRDLMHFPGQIKPLAVSVIQTTMAGANLAFAYYGIPNVLCYRRINTYLYGANAAPPAPDASPDQILEKVNAVISRLQAHWDEAWLPEIRTHLAYWEDFPLRSATMPSLLAHLDETLIRYARLWELHFRIVVPTYNAVSFFDDLYQDLFGKENPFGAYALLEGLSNKTVEMGQSLWRLSRKAAADPGLRAAIEAGEAENVLGWLEQSEAGRAFLVDLAAYLQEYGQRGELWGLAYPSWREDPTPLIRALRDYVAQSERDLDLDLTAAAARREERIAQARGAIQGYPQPVIRQFESLLEAAQVGIVLSEDHGFWIDFGGDYAVRQVLLEFGRRLAEAGVIEEAGDVFYLWLDELRATAMELPHLDRKELVAARKAEEARFAAVEPPTALGTPPAGEPPADDPFVRADVKFWGAPAQPAKQPGQFTGLAGAPGTARGPAKVVRNLAEASKLQPGDILVAVTTAPPWTPLFATAAAVVTDTGGVLSHCAVVAREYGIPAVVGTGNASSLIHDGEFLEVDGLAGIVHILPTGEATKDNAGTHND